MEHLFLAKTRELLFISVLTLPLIGNSFTMKYFFCPVSIKIWQIRTGEKGTHGRFELIDLGLRESDLQESAVLRLNFCLRLTTLNIINERSNPLIIQRTLSYPLY